MSETIKSRIVGCLKGLQVGDAIGKQTENLKNEDIHKWYPNGVSGFEGEIGKTIPRYENRHYLYKMGETTDDTEQTIVVAKSIIENKEIRHYQIGEKLMACKKSNRPTLQLGKFQQIGDPSRVAYDGDGCGAAMRVAPIGIVFSSDKLEELVWAVFQSSIPTHGGQIAICAASAIAAAVCGAIEGKGSREILDISVDACRKAKKYRSSSIDIELDEIIINMYEDLENQDEISIAYLNEKYFPKTTIEIVPLAIALALITKSAEKATLIATNLGGDSDSVASMASAIAGAMYPETVNEEWYKIVEKINGEELLQMADDLYEMRNKF